MQSSSGTPIYRPLDSLRREIRLVKLLPAASDRTSVWCVLSHALLDDPDTHYEALSYLWGDEKYKTRINLDGREFPVDALCINQQDDVEKGGQVAFMTEIYKRADTVLSWLGPSAHRTDDLFDFLNDDNRFQGLRREGYPYEMQSKLRITWVGDAVREVFEENYVWRRIWIVQELCVTKKVRFCCGQKSITMDGMVSFVIYLNKFIDAIMKDARTWYHPGGRRGGKEHTPHQLMLGEWAREIDKTLTNLSYFNKRGKLLPNMQDAILEYGAWLASDRRDMIYALMGICEDSLDIKVDYTKGPKDLYCEFVKKCILSSGSLDILLIDSLYPSRSSPEAAANMKTSPQPHAIMAPLQNLPSWALDLGATLKDGSKLHHDLRFQNYDSGSEFEGRKDKGFSCILPNLENDTLYELSVGGLIVGEVSRIENGEPFEKKWSVDRIFRGSKKKDRYFTSDSHEEARCLTYLGDFDWANRYGGRLRGEKREQFLNVWKSLSSGPRGLFAPLTNTQKDDAVKVAIQSALSAEGKKFGMTDTEYYCLLPFSAELGDILFVPVKCRMPLVLRWLNNEEGDVRCRLIGSVYIHGLMDNEISEREDIDYNILKLV
ncbi:ankyrin and het domain-containing protein [Rutstroemia sp. NJR-2017a BVV2]|nr:ankyrin and het domain-containing protein [Rutstroemia sp. NJR-2017a BVV2]